MKRRVLPGFRLSLGITLVYAAIIILLPLAALIFKAASLGPADYWRIVSSDRAVASYGVTIGSALVATLFNLVFGLALAWVLVRYRFPGREAMTALFMSPLMIPHIVLGIAFEKQNIAFMVSLAFAIAASANFPVLFMSVLWKDCTTKGAVIGGFLGLISSVALTVVSPSVWEATLGNPKGSALFPYTSPALFSMAIGFVGIWLFSVLDNSQRAKVDRAGFLAQQVRSETGIGASAASGH